MPYRAYSPLIRPAVVEPLHAALVEIMRTCGDRPIVSIGLKPGNLINGDSCYLHTPVGTIRLFEDKT